MLTKELFDQLIEKARTNKPTLIALKSAAVKGQQFEFAANLRDIENECFPETDEVKKAKQRAKNLNLLFRMVELEVSEDVCWLLDQALKSYDKKKGKFSVEDAVKLRLQKAEIFAQ